jgi:hypothetical protein
VIERSDAMTAANFLSLPKFLPFPSDPVRPPALPEQLTRLAASPRGSVPAWSGRGNGASSPISMTVC